MSLKRAALAVLLGLICGSVSMAQKSGEKPTAPAAPAGVDLAEAMAQRLSHELQVKTVAGKPIQAGAVTLIPILAVEMNFAGGAAPSQASGAPGIDGVLMSGDARPLGFVAITKSGVKFISAGEQSK